MNITLSQLLALALKHWPRLLLLLVFLFLFNRKQIDISLQIGHPSPPPAAVQEEASRSVHTDLNEVPPAARRSWTEKLNIFGSSPTTLPLYEALKKLPEEEVAAFLERFGQLAREEQEKYGIPASIILANALLHSKAGNSAVAEEANNYFGLPTTPDWMGEQLKIGGKSFRKYQNAWTSFRDHSLFLSTGAYAALPKLGKTDYQRWAAAMEKQGYGSQEALAKQLILVIDDWQLFRLD